MNSIVNLMTKYDHRQHELSDWLLKLEQRFQLGQVEADKAKITWCQLLIGATGSSILAGLEDDATWEAAKETLLSRFGAGSVRDEAWASLKQLTRGSFAYRCPARTLLQRLLGQLAQEQARRPPSGQVLELPPADGSSNTPPPTPPLHLN